MKIIHFGTYRTHKNVKVYTIVLFTHKDRVYLILRLTNLFSWGAYALLIYNMVYCFIHNQVTCY